MCFKIADFALEQSCRVRLLAIVSRSKFADTILEEAAAFFCFVYAGLVDGYVFGKITRLDTDS